MATLRYDVDVDARRAEARIGAFALNMRQRITQAVRSLPDIEITADSTDAQREMARVRAALIELGNQRIGVDINAAEAQRRLAELNAALVRLGESGDIQIDADTAAAVAALRLLEEQVDDLDGRNVKVDVDKGALSRIAGFGKALAGIGAGAGVATAGAGSLTAAIVTLGGSLVSLSGLAPILVGGLLAGGAAAATLKVGLEGVGDVLTETDPTKFAEGLAKLAPSTQAFVRATRELGPAWREVRLDVQQRLFAGLGEETKRLGDTYLPILKTGMGLVSTQANLLARDVAAFALEGRRVADVEAVFRNTSAAMEAGRPVARNLLSALMDFGVVGSEMLPQLAGGFSEVTARWAASISEARANGDLERWIQGGIDTLAQLGNVVGNVGGSLGAIFTAAKASGADFLTTLESVTGRVEDFLKSTQGQNAMVAFFSESRDTIDALLPGLETLIRYGAQMVASFSNTGGLSQMGDALSRIAEVVGPLLPVLGELAGETLGALTAAAQTTAVVLAPLVAGIVALLDALGPAAGILTASVIAFVAVRAAVAAITPMLVSMAAAMGVTTIAGTALATVLSAVALPLALVAAGVVLVSGAIQEATGDLDGWAKGMIAGGEAARQARAEFEAHNAQFVEGSVLAGLFAKSEGELTAEIERQIAALGPAEQATARAQLAQIAYNDAVRLFGESSPQAIAAQAALAAATNNQEAAQHGASAATQDHTDRMVAQQEAINASLGTGIAYEQSLRGVERAQRDAATATRDHGAGSLEARDAVGRLESSVLSATEAAGRKAAADSGATNEADKNRIATQASTLELLRWASGADGPAKDAALRMLSRLSDTELQTLQNTGAMNGFGVEIHKTPDGKSVAVTTPGLDAARGGIKGLTEDIRTINGKTVSIFVTATGSGGIASAGRLATGGILPGYTPGRDVHRFVGGAGTLDLSGGEAVMRPEWTRVMTPAYVHEANRAARLGGVAGVQGFLARTGPRGSGVEGVRGDGAAFATGGVLCAQVGRQVRAQRFAGGGVVVNTGYRRDMSGFNAAMAAMESRAIELGKAAYGGSGLAPGAGVERWRPMVGQALGIAGQSQAYQNITLRRMNQESGGNPNAINRTDINWTRGTPSVGLMQVIGPTYRAYRHPSYDSGPYSYGSSLNPLSNTLASMRYALARYGSLSAAYNKRGGYAAGAILPARLADRGALIRSGEAGVNLSGMPERMLSPAATAAYDSRPAAPAVTTIHNAFHATFTSTIPAGSVEARKAIGWIREELRRYENCSK